MPPSAIKSIRDLIYWQYVKILSEMAGLGKGNYSSLVERHAELKSGKLDFCTSVTELIKEHENIKTCIYCGRRTFVSENKLLTSTQKDGMNSCMVCGNCRISKGVQGIYQWYGLDQRNMIPKIAEAKYLKLLYEMHNEKGTLDVEDVSRFCPACILEPLCPKKKTLTVYCLEGPFL